MAKRTEIGTQRVVKVFKSRRGQTVRLPKEFEFSTAEVRIRKQGDDVILSPWPADWSAYLSSDRVASEEFMQRVDDLPPQTR
jgi:antitoxin VapB